MTGLANSHKEITMVVQQDQWDKIILLPCYDALRKVMHSSSNLAISVGMKHFLLERGGLTKGGELLRKAGNSLPCLEIFIKKDKNIFTMLCSFFKFSKLFWKCEISASFLLVDAKTHIFDIHEG